MDVTFFGPGSRYSYLASTQLERVAGETGAIYAANLAAALAAGAFGVPTFVAPDGAVFWGKDRLPLLIHHLKSL